MKKRILIALVVVLALAASASLVWANVGDPWADLAIAIYRVDSGTSSTGAPINTNWDNGDNGIDATGAPDWFGSGSGNTAITTPGIDMKGTSTTTDDDRGWVVLAFTDNVCLDGPGPDLYIYDAYGSQSENGNESADIDVAIGSGSFAAAGSVSPGAGYALDVSGALPFFTRVRVTAIDFAGQKDLAGFDLDAVECLNSASAAPVSIDIKPGSYPNCFNSDGHGVIPVAILGSEDFDASTVDPFSVALDGAEVRVKGKSGNAGSLDDVNGDGYLDLVLQIIDDSVYTGDTTAILTGSTYDGMPIEGSDSVCIRPPE